MATAEQVIGNLRALEAEHIAEMGRWEALEAYTATRVLDNWRMNADRFDNLVFRQAWLRALAP